MRRQRVKEYINSNDILTPSDIVEFVMSQPDFYEDAAYDDGR